VGDGVNLDGSGTYISNVPDSEKQKGLTFSWLCPEGLTTICEGVTVPILFIAYDAYGPTMKVGEAQTITLVTTRQEVSGAVKYEQSIEITWSDIKRPSFTLRPPQRLFVTRPNQFKVAFDDEDSKFNTNLQI
jgi:hypothetical protein